MAPVYCPIMPYDSYDRGGLKLGAEGLNNVIGAYSLGGGAIERGWNKVRHMVTRTIITQS